MEEGIEKRGGKHRRKTDSNRKIYYKPKGGKRWAEEMKNME